VICGVGPKFSLSPVFFQVAKQAGKKKNNHQEDQTEDRVLFIYFFININTQQ